MTVLCRVPIIHYTDGEFRFGSWIETPNYSWLSFVPYPPLHVLCMHQIIWYQKQARKKVEKGKRTDTYHASHTL